MLNPLRWFVKDEAETYSLGDDAVLKAFYGALARLSTSGVAVNEETAVRCVAVLACLIVRSQTFSSLPLDVLRAEGGQEAKDPTHPAYRLLSIAPNDLMNAKEFWRWEQLTQDLRGNAYAQITWSGLRPAEIWPLYGAAPELVIDRARRTALWSYSGDDFTPAGPLPLRDVLHFKGTVLRTPFLGASLIDLASEAIGVNIGTEQFFSRMLGNGSHFPGYLETDRELKPEDVKALTDQLKDGSGLLGAGTLRIFDRGLKYQQNQMSLKDAQLIEQMRWQLQQICSVFRVPMAAVQDLTNGTYTNSEQQDLWLAKHTVAPICTETEAVLRHRLFVNEPTYRAKFNMDGLLRGDYATRTAGDATLVRAGIIVRNEARSHYDLNPIEGLDMPEAELTLGTVTPDGLVHLPSAPTDAPPPIPSGVAAMFEPLLEDAFACIKRRALTDAAHGKTPQETVAFALTKLAPIVAAHAGAGLEFDAETFIAAALASPGDTPAKMIGQGDGPEEGVTP